MSKKSTKVLAFVICVMMVLTLFAACDSGVYVVTYSVNYEGGADRSITLTKGQIAPYYDAMRSGYDLLGWYSDKTFSKQYNFDTAVGGNITLYARWQKQPEKLHVTFDPMMDGEQPVVVSVLENQTIAPEQIPVCSKLGFNYQGWYTDEQLTTEWYMEEDKVTQDITLYAKYVPDLSIERDVNGNINFINVTVNMFASDGFGVSTGLLNEMVTKFNEEYSGRIKVFVSNSIGTTSQDNFALRFQQVAGANENITRNYYKASSVYDLAGLTFDSNDWYANATRNCYVDGSLYTIPTVAGVPYLIYNKSLMTKYNGDNPLPTNYNEFSALLNKVYEGEVTRNPKFKTILTGTNWPFREATSMTAYIQNDAEYYVYEDGKYINKWGNKDSATYQKAISALSNVYNLFGDGGSCHGGLSEDSHLDNLTRGAVSGNKGQNPSAFMGIVNVCETDIKNYVALGYLGILPLSGLFATEGSVQASQIPVHMLGFQFYKAKNVSITELAAAAVFADYVSKNTHSFAQRGWYPMNKNVTSADAFAKPYGDNYTGNEVIYWVLKNVGDPENFRTLDGYTYEKQIENTIAGEQFMVTGGVLAMKGENVNDTYIADQIYKLQSTLLQFLD